MFTFSVRHPRRLMRNANITYVAVLYTSFVWHCNLRHMFDWLLNEDQCVCMHMVAYCVCVDMPADTLMTSSRQRRLQLIYSGVIGMRLTLMRINKTLNDRTQRGNNRQTCEIHKQYTFNSRTNTETNTHRAKYRTFKINYEFKTTNL